MARLILLPDDELIQGLCLGQELDLELTVVVTELLPDPTESSAEGGSPSTYAALTVTRVDITQTT